MKIRLAALLSAAFLTAPAAFAAPAACTGKAPSGELTAQRIVAANPTRSEPGLYEGPVWIKDALYFSDFTFGPGFPSRIQKLDASGKVTT
ncbi:MAG TPA: SMP-30/gluconolactonase/LRE family protein, partial [Duganella sp.]